MRAKHVIHQLYVFKPCASRAPTAVASTPAAAAAAATAGTAGGEGQSLSLVSAVAGGAVDVTVLGGAAVADSTLEWGAAPEAAPEAMPAGAAPEAVPAGAAPGAVPAGAAPEAVPAGALPAPSEPAPPQPALLPMDFDDVLDATTSEFSMTMALSGWTEYLQLGLPSAAMLFAEWASYEVTAVIAGLISVNALATHSVLATTASLAFMPILGFGVATMIRIGNRLGERRPEEAKLSLRVALVVWLCYAALNAAFLLSVAPVWGRVFTEDAAVDAHVQRILWVLALYGIFDTGQCVLCFVFRALGRPGLAAAANLTGYAGVGLPLAYVFGVTLGGSVLGMWLGYAVAVTVVFVLLALTLRCMDWKLESEVAFKRATAAPTASGAE